MIWLIIPLKNMILNKIEIYNFECHWKICYNFIEKYDCECNYMIWFWMWLKDIALNFIEGYEFEYYK